MTKIASDDVAQIAVASSDREGPMEKRASDHFVTPPGAAYPKVPEPGAESVRKSKKAAALEDLVEAQHFLRVRPPFWMHG